MTCTVLLKKLLDSGPDPIPTTPRRKPPEETQRRRGDATFYPHSYSLNMERKPGVAGGSKWTYEATFPIT